MLERWDPFRDLFRIERSINHFWRNPGANGEGRNRWAVPLNVVDRDDDFIVEATLPGVKPDDINVTIDDGLLTVEGETHSELEENEGGYLLKERRTGKFSRRLRIPDTVDADKAETAYVDGVLTITLPKAEAKKPKRLAIKAGG